MRSANIKAWSDNKLLASWKEAEARGLNMGEWCRENRFAIYTTIPKMHEILLEGPKPDKSPIEIDMPSRWAVSWPSFMVVGDVQIPTTDWRLVELVAYVAERRLKPPRRLVIAGDFNNFDAWSVYPATIPPPSWQLEKEAGRKALNRWLEVFEDIRWLFGNHERRKLRAMSAVEDEDDILNAFKAQDKRIQVSVLDRMTIDTPAGPWSILHGEDYSQNLLVKADLYAQKFQTHIAAAHAHRAGIGMDRFNRYMIASIGGLFDPTKMAYVQVGSNSKPEMAQGFLLVEDGYPTLLSPTLTDWERL